MIIRLYKRINKFIYNYKHHHLIPFSRRKVTKKNEHTQACEHFFEKQIDLSIKYGAHIHDRSLLVRVKSECHIQKAKPFFFKKLRATLKYGLHWDAVISRWAREHANEVGALDDTKKKRYIQIYRSFSGFLEIFTYFPSLYNSYI
jgi:hypothetical protein